VAGVSLVPAAVGDVATPTKGAVEIERDWVRREGEGKGERERGGSYGKGHGEERGGREGFGEGNRGRVCGEERGGRGGLWAGNRGRVCGEERGGKGGFWEGDTGAERRATVIRLLSLGISHGRLPSSMGCVNCRAAMTVFRARLSALGYLSQRLRKREFSLEFTGIRWNLRVCDGVYGVAWSLLSPSREEHSFCIW